MARLIALLALVLCGCDSPEAPTDVSDLMRYLVREFDREDPAYLSAGAQNMAGYLSTVDYEADSAGRSTIPDSLYEADLVGISRFAGTDPEDTVNVSLAYRSSRPIEDHARLQAEVDHTIAEPSAVSYVRAWDDEPDPTCFADRSCTVLRTTNQIERSNLLFSVEFELFKHFRWTEIEDGRSMIVARAWFDGEFTASNGAVLRQSYTLDVWLENGLGGTDRVQVLYSETVFDPEVEANTKRAVTRISVDSAMSTTDEALATLFD